VVHSRRRREAVSDPDRPAGLERVNFGFLIDNRLCIGCHACSTACKQENQVPLGVHRTWVKSIEKGAFPHTRRHFQVTRCNHCANPPCVRICPVSAMYQRADGIVDFDPRVCIGCKACLQACPYDAIYVDPDSGTAAKCHYCAHRVEVGLEPACVIVCPEHAIISGDLDDPESEISRLVARHPVMVRKPEQGTAPKLFYIEGEAAALTPTAAAMVGTFAFAEVATDQAAAMHAPGRPRQPVEKVGSHRPSGAAVRAPTEQSVGSWAGPIYVGQTRVAEQLVQTTFNAQHKVPWHWPVPAYLVTKAIGSGLALLMALLMVTYFPPSPGLMTLLGATSLLFTGLTALLLILDLERPERFYLILTRPQWSSWLTRGAFILLGHTVVVGLVTAAAFAGWRAPDTAAPWLGPWAALVAAVALGLSGIATAAYTGYLFGQAEGRDLWQSPLLPVHLVVQALLAGAAAVVVLMSPIIFQAMGAPGRSWMTFRVADDLFWGAVWLLLIALVVDGLMLRAGELGMPHASEAAARAAHAIRRGRYRRWYRLGALWLGHLVPLLLVPLGVLLSDMLSKRAFRYDPLATDGPMYAAVLAAALLSIVGLYCYEHAFVMAPQEVPNS
jgi:Fe-S-cluster-containing dehydrogenase component/formate-dependent nitrite reductase membrane component NrfD